jgi:hypothetical protein
VLESVQKAKSLDEAQSENCQKPGVGDNRDHSAEAESGALKDRKLFRIANQNFGDGIQARQGHKVHMAEISDVKSMLFFELPPKLFPVDFDRAKPAQEAKSS